jgi:hypothetical protein
MEILLFLQDVGLSLLILFAALLVILGIFIFRI